MSGEGMPEDLRASIESLARGDSASGPTRWRDWIMALAEGPDPREAATRALALPPRVWTDPGPSPAVARLLHEGPYPLRMIQLDPSVASWLGRESLDLERAALRRRIEAKAVKHGIDEAVARVRNEVYLLLAMREIEGRQLEEIGGPLEALVGACVEAALHAHDPALLDEVCVFAMGKLAGDELNYLSDVDFIFVHADDPPDAASATAAHARRNRIHAGLRALLRALEGPARWRPVFRVDLRLRPFGTRGPMSLSSTATLAYYERHGRDWERQVWLRATPIAGELEMGAQVARGLEPFVYRRTLGPAIFDEVEDIMRRARREARRNRLAGEGVDLKLDRGGIREIEFFAQAMQLIHAGRRPTLRSPSTLITLDRLAAAGLFSDHDHRVLVGAYRWLRRVEHRIQLGAGQQTHRVPGEPEARAALARRLHASGDLAEPSCADLQARLERERAAVCEVTALFGDEEAPQRAPEARRSWAREVVLDQGSSRALTVDALAALGVRDPEDAAALLAHLDARADGPWRVRGAAREGATRLLTACLDSADPDRALQRLAEFAQRRPGHYAIWRLLEDPKHGELVRRIADLFGASEPLSRGLIGVPGGPSADEDGAIALLFATRDAALPTAEELREAWAESRAQHPNAMADASPGPPPPEEFDRELLHFKSLQLVRIGSHDLAHRSDPLEVGRCLSELADLLVQALADSVVEQFERPGAAPLPSLTMVAFAIGKYGMSAMDYGSDLDLFFVFDADKAELAMDPAAKVARRFLARMQGRSARDRLYEVDMRLRPSGGQGLLVSSLGGFERYHAEALPTWERLALLRARPVAHFVLGGGTRPNHPEGPDAPAGPDALAAKVMACVERSCFGHRDAEFSTLAGDIRALKARIEEEISRETRNQKDVKTGRGGALECELLIGGLQLAHGASSPALRGRDILHALSALADAGVLEPTDAERIDRAYRFVRRLLNRLRMQSGGGSARSPDRFDINSPRLRSLARRMGVAGADALIREHARQSSRIREAFDRYLPPSDPEPDSSDDPTPPI